MAEEAVIKVCIGNYGYYNEGELRDAWIELPKTEQEIADFLQEKGLQDPLHEEIYISDYDGMPLGINSATLFNEYTRLDELNLLAMQIAYDPDAAEKVADALDTGVDVPDSLVGLMNWIEQADDIPFYGYDYDAMGAKDSSGHAWDEYLTNEEKLGQTLLDNHFGEFKEMLENISGAERAFDVEKFGEAYAYDYYLGDKGYIGAHENMPDEGRWTLEELKEIYEESIEATLAHDKPSGISIPAPKTCAVGKTTIEQDVQRHAQAPAQAAPEKSREATR